MTASVRPGRRSLYQQLHRARYALAAREQRQLAALDRLAARSRALMAQGREASSTAQQRVLARQIQTLNQEERGIRQQLALLRRPLELVRRLLLLRDGATRPAAGLLAQIDWPALLREIESLQGAQAVQLEHLDQVVALLEQAMPAAAPPETPPAGRPAVALARVERVIDGDTIDLVGGERLRYLGIDCPELHGWDGEPEFYARQARARNQALVENQELRLERDVSERDRFGRLLRYVYVNDTFVNALLVREGYAHAFILPPDLRHAALLEKLEEKARRRGRGIWGEPQGD